MSSKKELNRIKKFLSENQLRKTVLLYIIKKLIDKQTLKSR